jgi:hypothetical protein
LVEPSVPWRELFAMFRYSSSEHDDSDDPGRTPVSWLDSAENLRSSGSPWNTSGRRLVRPLKETSRCLIPEVLPAEDDGPDPAPDSTPLRSFRLRSSTRSRGMRSSSGGTAPWNEFPERLRTRSLSRRSSELGKEPVTPRPARSRLTTRSCW